MPIIETSEINECGTSRGTRDPFFTIRGKNISGWRIGSKMCRVQVSDYHYTERLMRIKGAKIFGEGVAGPYCRIIDVPKHLSWIERRYIAPRSPQFCAEGSASLARGRAFQNGEASHIHPNACVENKP